MDYAQTIKFLFESLPVFEDKGAGAYKPGLERVRQFAASLGDPHNDFVTVHVAGTNGKGSVSHMLASVLQAAGYRTGLYTSPHLLDFRERIRIDGEMISEQAVVDFTDRHKDEMLRLGLTFFEMATVMAFDRFSQEGVDVAVIETGLGGRLDATNIITPAVSVITNIAVEHTQYLGDTIPLIAAEKAGIIKAGVPVVVGETHPESAPVFIEKAAALGSPITFADQIYKVTAAEYADGLTMYDVAGADGERTFFLDLAGDYQRKNIVTALTAVDLLRRKLEISPLALHNGIRRAAASTGLAGRWHTLGQHPLVVCDTAHNAHGMAQVALQLSQQKYRSLIMVLGFASDKDIDAIIPLLPRGARYILTQASVGRAMPVDDLHGRFAAHGIDAETVVPVSAAIEKALSIASTDDMVYIGGSNFTVAEALPLWKTGPLK